MSNPQTQKQPPKSTTSKAFTFWAYFTISISLLTLLLSQFPFNSNPNSNKFFHSLPDNLLLHHSKGKLIKTHPHTSKPPLELFAIESGPKHSPPILLLHGLASSSFSFRTLLPLLANSDFRTVALDLPGSGFSDNLPLPHPITPLRTISNIFMKIKQEGIFWGFDQLVETGGITYQDSRIPETELNYGPEAIARIIAQAAEALELADVHLVLHDSALVPGLNFAAANRGVVRSLTLIDSASGLPAFPSVVLGVPVVGGIVARSRFLFRGLLRVCCSRDVDEETAEAYRVLVEGKEGRRAVVEAGRGLNLSFDLGEWMRSEVGRDVPVQVLWSNMWSDRWIDEGKKVAADLPMVNFSHHSGGRWPQEDAPKEIADKILEFVSSLPKLTRKTMQEPQSHKLETSLSDHEDHDHVHIHDHHYHGFGPGHEYGANIYGLDM